MPKAFSRSLLPARQHREAMHDVDRALPVPLAQSRHRHCRPDGTLSLLGHLGPVTVQTTDLLIVTTSTDDFLDTIKKVIEMDSIVLQR